MSVAKRLSTYIEYKGISYYAFENSIGASRGAISKAVKENKNIGSQSLENILTLFSDLNSDWLLTGQGEMIKIKEVPPELLKESTLVIAEVIKSKDKEIALQYQVIEVKQRLVEKLDDDIAKLKAEIEDLKAQLASR